jgi:serine/threonine protein kinase
MLTGSTLGRYKILEKIGAGGMGEVYLAHDEQLDRKVALKILLPEIAKDEDRVRRFKLEAKAVSALNYPNIITIYEIAEANDRLFIVYEFINGKTLREKIRRNQLTIVDAVKIAEQTAKALAVAHQAGIIHRDIKPENIMVRDDDYVKVLDFGLAKKRIFTTENEAETIQQINTQRGVIMGSVQYMSPEQARGLAIDERTDIWSLGVVLYEMLTGKNPFEGETISDSIAALINREPEPISNFIKDIPKNLQNIVNKSLQKKLSDRYQNINEFLTNIKEIDLDQNWFNKETLEITQTEGSENEDTNENRTLIKQTHLTDNITDEQKRKNTISGKSSTKKSKRFYFAIAGVILSIIAISTIGSSMEWLSWSKGFFTKDQRMPFQSYQVSQLTSDGKALYSAISPDGKYVAYVNTESTGKGLMVRQIATGSSVQIIPPEKPTVLNPTFSPDSNYIYFLMADNNLSTLYQVPTIGGKVKEFPDIHSSISFSFDGKQIAYLNDEAVYIANQDGTDAHSFLTPDETGYKRFEEVSWLPDGKNLLLQVLKKEVKSPEPGYQFLLVSLADKKVQPFGDRLWAKANYHSWSQNGEGIYFTGKAKFDDKEQIWFSEYPSGISRRITNDLDDYVSLSITLDGTKLLTGKVQRISSLWNFSPQTKKMVQLTPESNHDDGFYGLKEMPDGNLIYTKLSEKENNLWIKNLDGTTDKQLTSESGFNQKPDVTPDGEFIVFSSNRKGDPSIWRINSDGENPVQLTSGENVKDLNPQIANGGKTVIFERIKTDNNSSTLANVSIEGGEVRELFPGEKAEFFKPSVSNDGKQVAFIARYTDENTKKGKQEMRIASVLEDGSVKLKKTVEFKSQLFHWSADDKSILYVTPKGLLNLWSFSIESGEDKPLTEFNSGILYNFTYLKGGKEILMLRGNIHSDLVLMKDEQRTSR